MVSDNATGQSDPSEYVTRILAAAADYDVAGCEAQLAAASTLPTLRFVRDVIGPVLRAAGNRWHQGEFTVMQEHMVSGVVRRQLSYALDRLASDAAGPRILFTTLAGERHEMGSLMTAVVAASLGARCIYVGPDLPVVEVGRFCRHQPADVVALSLVTQPEVNDAPGQLRALRQELAGPIQIWIGGQAASLLRDLELPPGVTRLRSLEDFLSSLAALRQRQEEQ